MEVESCPNCASAKTLPGHLHSGGGGGAFLTPLILTPVGAGIQRIGVTVSSGFHCCLSCGRVWGRLNPDQVQAFIGTHGTKLGKQCLETLLKGPYHDLPDHPAAREAAEHVAEIDALMVAGQKGVATRRYRDLTGKTWDEAIADMLHWSARERAEKLALFGWCPKEKPDDKHGQPVSHPMRDRWLDG